jgi:hypothetical protein
MLVAEIVAADNARLAAPPVQATAARIVTPQDKSAV